VAPPPHFCHRSPAPPPTSSQVRLRQLELKKRKEEQLASIEAEHHEEVLRQVKAKEEAELAAAARRAEKAREVRSVGLWAALADSLLPPPPPLPLSQAPPVLYDRLVSWVAAPVPPPATRERVHAYDRDPLGWPLLHKPVCIVGAERGVEGGGA
jgi:hypothetical protein